MKRLLLLALTLLPLACADEPPQMRVLEGKELELKRAEAHTRLALRLAGEGEFPRPEGRPKVNEGVGDWYCPVFFPWAEAGGLCPSPSDPPATPGWDGFSASCSSTNDLNQPGFYMMTGPNGNGWCTVVLQHNWSWFGEHWYSNPNLGTNGMAWNDRIRSWQSNDVKEIYLWEHTNYGGNAFTWNFNDNDWYMRWYNMPQDRSSVDLLFGW